jgi:hypothetical protein
MNKIKLLHIINYKKINLKCIASKERNSHLIILKICNLYRKRKNVVWILELMRMIRMIVKRYQIHIKKNLSQLIFENYI